MKLLITIIILILIFYIFLGDVVLGGKDEVLKSREGYSSYMYDMERDIIHSNKLSIEDPISEVYLPHSVDVGSTDIDSVYNYRIVNIYKEILNRQPNSRELIVHRRKFITGEQDEDFLRVILYNNVEYMNIMDLQSNAIEYRLEHSIMKKKLYDMITALFEQHRKGGMGLKASMLPILRDVMIHLRFDLYLFVSVLKDKKYDDFEKDIMETIVINKYNIREIFYRHYDLKNLKEVAELMKEEDLKNGKSSLLSSVFSVDLLRERRKEEEERLKEEARQRVKDYANNKRCKFEKKIRIDDPIDHKMPHKSNWANRPPICTTLGMRSNVNPQNKNRYMSSPTWTTIEESKKTGMGSIMPKFEYKEYVEYVKEI